MARPRSIAINYDEPPVVEVAMSVQFDPTPGLSIAHLGLFWASRRGEFPNVRTSSPIPAVPEEFGPAAQWLPPSFRLALIDEPQCRLQMTSADDQWVCQIQPDRIVVNWRKKRTDYPRFAATLDRFKDAWNGFGDFLAREKIGLPAPRFWEVAYVNRIPQGELWHSPADWPDVFPGLWGGRFSSSGGLVMRGLRGQWVWDSAVGPARLYIEPSPSRSEENPPVELLMVNLTARGPIDKDGDAPAAPVIEQAIESGMNLGHDLIVSTFDTIASAPAKKHWKRHV